MSDEDYLEVEVEVVIRETNAAILIRLDDDETDIIEAEQESDEAPLDPQEVWIPKSAIHDDSEVFESNDSGVLYVKGWFARKRGWV